MISNSFVQLERFVRGHSQEIYTSLAVGGLGVTAYLSAKAGMRHNQRLADKSPHLSKTEVLKEVWTFYIPPAATGAATIACIVLSHRVGAKKAMAAQAAFAVTERAYSEYRDKVREEIGETKEQKIRDSIVKDRLERNPPPTDLLALAATGTPLAQEGYTGRYFLCDMETLRRALNDLNAKLVNHGYAYLSDLYYLLDLENTSVGDSLGWESDRMLEFEFSPSLTTEGKPCLVFDYNYIKPL